MRILNGAYQVHNGIDYISLSGNPAVVCMAGGVVIYDQDDYDPALRWTVPRHSAGNMVITKSTIAGTAYYIRYLHLNKNSVKVGDAVNEGDIIGEYGDAGYSFGAHVHVDFFTMGWANIDPTEIILKNLS